jgi:uncharacterized RDD family membrane protein YckC
MKCPKCGYLGFDRADRCRNCGYDFSLAPPPEFPELSIRDEPPSPGVLGDLTLTRGTDAAGIGQTIALTPELPLFGSTSVDDAPLITKASPPRTPLAVRRATPDIPRSRPASIPRTPMLDLGDGEPGMQRSGPAKAGRHVRGGSYVGSGAYVGSGFSRTEHEHDQWTDATPPAGIAARIFAVAFDLTLLLAIDAAVVYFTIQICGLTMADWALLPKAPLLAFLALQNGGYLVAFTAGGQTLGMMAAGIRVVSTRDTTLPSFADSLLRTVVWFLLAMPAGLGLLTALMTPDRRGLHDRCAGTKVVRASA